MLLSGVGGMDEAKTQSLEENRLLLTKTNERTNENHPVGEKLNWLVSRQGRAGQGKAELDKARQSWTRQGRAGQGKAELDKARQSWTRQGRAGQGKAELDKARQSWTRQGRAGQGRTGWPGHRRHQSLHTNPHGTANTRRF